MTLLLNHVEYAIGFFDESFVHLYEMVPQVEHVTPRPSS